MEAVSAGDNDFTDPVSGAGAVDFVGWIAGGVAGGMDSIAAGKLPRRRARCGEGTRKAADVGLEGRRAKSSLAAAGRVRRELLAGPASWRKLRARLLWGRKNATAVKGYLKTMV